jgi:DNA-binding protein HU-beta
LTRAKAKEVLDAHAELLVSELRANGSVQLAGIGKLKMGERAERQGRNPSTGEAITIKASNKPSNSPAANASKTAFSKEL